MYANHFLAYDHKLLSSQNNVNGQRTQIMAIFEPTGVALGVGPWCRSENFFFAYAIHNAHNSA